MSPVPTLRDFLPPPSHRVHPLARLHDGGLMDVCAPWIPAPGAFLLVVWRPGEEPAFALLRATLRPHGARWRVEAAGEGAPREGWVVLAVAEGAPGAAGQGF